MKTRFRMEKFCLNAFSLKILFLPFAVLWADSLYEKQKVVRSI